MAERYTRLFSLSENLYTAGAPIVIAAGALLKDNQTGKTLAQLKFKSLSEKNIKALKVTIAASDVSGNTLTGVDEYQYLDLAVERNETFGQKQAIYLPDAVTRSIAVKCTEVIFEDGTAWKAAEEAIWNTLPEQETIDDCLKELAAQYQRDTSRLSKYALLEHEDLWLCTCGAINHNEEAACHRCNYEKAELLEAMDLEGLQTRKADYDREAAEAAEKRAREAAERAEKKAAEDKVRRAKVKKIGIIATAVVAVVVAAYLTLFYMFPKTVLRYDKAYAILMSNGKGATEKQKEAALGVVIETCRSNRSAWAATHEADYKGATSFEKPILELPDLTFKNKTVEEAFLQYKNGVYGETLGVNNAKQNENWAQAYLIGALMRYEAIITLSSEGVINLPDEDYKQYSVQLLLTDFIQTLVKEDYDDENYMYKGSITNTTPAILNGIVVTLTWDGGSLSSNPIKELNPGETWDVYFVIPNSVPVDTNFNASMDIGEIHN